MAATNSLRLREILVSIVLVATVAGVVLGIWELIVWKFELPKALLPTPKQCWDAAVLEKLPLFRATLSTGFAAIAGLLVSVVIGYCMAVIFSQSRGLRLALFPYVILLQTVPIVAIAPLLIIWSGYTFRTVVIVTAIVCLFPIVNSVTGGLLSTKQDTNDLFRLYGAGRWKRLLHLQIPSSVNHLMLGIKTSSGLAVIGAIVAEFFVGNGTTYDGLGTLMTGWTALVKTDALVSAVFASALLGVLMFGSVHLISTVCLRRWTQVATGSG